MHSLSKVTVDAIVSALLSGESTSSIAIKFHVHPTTVHKIRRTHNLNVPRILLAVQKDFQLEMRGELDV
jgi:hypothetical protein